MCIDEYRIDRGVHVFVLGPSLMAGNRAELREAVDRLLDAGEYDVVVDLTQTATIDSAGLGLLAAVDRAIDAARQGPEQAVASPRYRQLSVRAAHGDVLSLLRSTRLDDMFRMI